jgi:hypothetical protein
MLGLRSAWGARNLWRNQNHLEAVGRIKAIRCAPAIWALRYHSRNFSLRCHLNLIMEYQQHIVTVDHWITGSYIYIHTYIYIYYIYLFIYINIRQWKSHFMGITLHFAAFRSYGSLPPQFFVGAILPSRKPSPKDLAGSVRHKLHAAQHGVMHIGKIKPRHQVPSFVLLDLTSATNVGLVNPPMWNCYKLLKACTPPLVISGHAIFQRFHSSNATTPCCHHFHSSPSMPKFIKIHQNSRFYMILHILPSASSTPWRPSEASAAPGRSGPSGPSDADDADAADDAWGRSRTRGHRRSAALLGTSWDILEPVGTGFWQILDYLDSTWFNPRIS